MISRARLSGFSWTERMIGSTARATHRVAARTIIGRKAPGQDSSAGGASLVRIRAFFGQRQLSEQLRCSAVAFEQIYRRSPEARACARRVKEQKMAEEIENLTDTNMEQIKIALNALYLCIGYSIKHISSHEGLEAADKFKAEMLQALKNGDIDMALLEERKTFDLIVSKIESLPTA